jgi:tetratricopeptide (TPR) repeat protein
LLHEDSSALAELGALRMAPFQGKAGLSSRIQAEADYLSGVARYHLGDYPRALSDFESSLARDSAYSPHTLFFCKGSVLYTLGRYAEALGCFARVYPDSIRTSEEGEVAFLTGASLMALKRHDEAAQAFRLFLAKTRNPALSPEANFFFGLSEYYLGKLPEAGEAFRRVILAHPRFYVHKSTKALLARPGPLPLQPVPLRHDTLRGQHFYTDEALFLLSLCDYKSGNPAEAESLLAYLNAYFPGSNFSLRAKLLNAIVLFDQRNWDKAEPALLSLAGGPFGAEALFRLGLIYSQNGNPRWAGRSFERVLEGHPESPYVSQALLRLGELAYERRDFAYAGSLFRRLIRDHPNSGLADDARLGLGWSAYRGKRYREAHQAFEAFAAANPSSPQAGQALFRSGVSAFLGGEEESAILALKKYAALDPVPAARDSALWLVAQSYDRLKRPAKAAEAYREFLSACPDHALVAESYLALGKALLESGEFKAAITAFDEAERTSRTEGLRDEARYRREIAKLGKRGQSDPLLVSEKFIARYPGSPRAPKLLLDIAEYQRAVRKGEKALATLARLEEDYPFSSEALRGHLLRARISEAMGDHSSAIREYQAALDRKDPEVSPQALLGLAGAYQGLRQYDIARDQLRRLLVDYWFAGETEEALLEIARSYDREGRYAEALEAYQNAETRTRGRRSLEAQLGQGNCLLGEALYAKAVGLFIKLSHQPDIPRDLLAQSLYGQGAAQSALGDTTRALDAFTRALDLTSDPQAKARLQRQIDLLAQRGQE